ncbi:MAG: hypothetical protein IRZ33_03605 [Alicyclobacillaceae bacterium]|nr:hypothetical protein [Alicyclobacillaceae bacterium]
MKQGKLEPRQWRPWIREQAQPGRPGGRRARCRGAAAPVAAAVALLSAAWLAAGCGPAGTSGAVSGLDAESRGVLQLHKPPPGYHFNSVDFLTKSTGFVAGFVDDASGVSAGLLWVTTDGGRTWTARTTPAGAAFSYIHFTSSQAGWAIRLNGERPGAQRAELWATRDAGRTWRRVVANAVTADIGSCEERVGFPGGATGEGFAVLGGRLWMTSDGGTHWRMAPLPAAGLWVAAADFATPHMGWVAAERFGAADPETGARSATLTVYRTTDGGRTWRAELTRSRPDPVFRNVSLQFTDQHHGWLMVQTTDDMVTTLSRTTDGGRSWALVQPKLFQARFAPGALDFVSPTTGWIPVSSGASPLAGLIALTTDGGRTFRTLGANRYWSILSADLVSASDGWAAGEYAGTTGYLLHTTDGGRSFEQVLPSPYPVGPVSFVDDHTAYGAASVSDPAAVVRTDDGGRTWRVAGRMPLSGDSYRLRSLAFASTNDGYLLAAPANPYQKGAAPSLYRTGNGGASWALVSSRFPQGLDWNGSQMRAWPGGRLMVEAQMYPSVVILVSKDGGHTWHRYATVPHVNSNAAGAAFTAFGSGYVLANNPSFRRAELWQIQPRSGSAGGVADVRLVRSWAGQQSALALSATADQVAAALAAFRDRHTVVTLWRLRIAGGTLKWSVFQLPHPASTASAALADVFTQPSVTTASADAMWWFTFRGPMVSTDGGATWQGLLSG